MLSKNRILKNGGMLVSESEISRICALTGITKAGGNRKSDLYVNGMGVSVKSFGDANPAIVNHTHRPGFEKACNESGSDIGQLDVIIAEYWRLRVSGEIREDVRNSHLQSPFSNFKTYLKPILNYFMFDGSGRGRSQNSADVLLDIINPCDTTTWMILGRDDALDLIWDYLVMSVRSKGMPKSYAPGLKPSLDVWTRYFDNLHKGTLHVRVHKSFHRIRMMCMSGQ